MKMKQKELDKYQRKAKEKEKEMPNSINIKIKEINFCDKKPFTIAFSSNSIINVELWLEDYKFLNIVNSFGENLFENFYDYFKIA